MNITGQTDMAALIRVMTAHDVEHNQCCSDEEHNRLLAERIVNLITAARTEERRRATADRRTTAERLTQIEELITLERSLDFHQAAGGGIINPTLARLIGTREDRIDYLLDVYAELKEETGASDG